MNTNKKYMKLIIAFTVLFFSYTVFSQTGIAVGGSIINGFGSQKYLPGINLGVEIPRDNESSLYVRASFTSRSTSTETVLFQAIDPLTSPVVKNGVSDFKNWMFNLEGGTRYYFGEGYDSGMALYGGTMVMLNTNGVVRKEASGVDETKYEFVNSVGEPYSKKGRIVSLNVGLNVGFKKHIGVGMVFFDVSAAYSILGLSSNDLANEYGTFSPLIFAFNLGFRRDLY
jgi:hypothetical protein